MSRRYHVLVHDGAAAAPDRDGDEWAILSSLSQMSETMAANCLHIPPLGPTDKMM